jgi:hypothetical protein
MEIYCQTCIAETAGPLRQAQGRLFAFVRNSRDTLVFDVPLLFGFVVGFFYVFYIPAVFLGGEGDAFFGVADGADAIGVDVDVFGVGRATWSA